jgi:hypothetical protein
VNKVNYEQGDRKRIAGGQVIKGLVYLGHETKTSKIIELINITLLELNVSNLT